MPCVPVGIIGMNDDDDEDDEEKEIPDNL
jgi:hypothetical protein